MNIKKQKKMRTRQKMVVRKRTQDHCLNNPGKIIHPGTAITIEILIKVKNENII